MQDDHDKHPNDWSRNGKYLLTPGLGLVVRDASGAEDQPVSEGLPPSGTANSRPTENGLRTLLMRLGNGRFMSPRSRSHGANGKSRPAGESSPGGEETAENSSIFPRTAK